MNTVSASAFWASKIAQANAASRQDCPIIRVIGDDAPYPVLHAMGFQAIRLDAIATQSTPRADALVGKANLSVKGRSILEQIIALPQDMPVLITHYSAEQAQLFAILRELLRTGEIAVRPVHFYDFLHMPRETTRRYNQQRFTQLTDWLVTQGGTALDEQTWQVARQCYARLSESLEKYRQIIGGTEFYSALAALQYMTPDSWQSCAQPLIESAVSGAAAKLTALCGADIFQHDQAINFADIGAHVVYMQQDRGDRLLQSQAPEQDWFAQFTDPLTLQPARFVPAAQRIDDLLKIIEQQQIEQVIYCVDRADESSTWDAGIYQRTLAAKGIECWCWDISTAVGERIAYPLVYDGERSAGQDKPRRKSPPKERQRSRKSLNSVKDFGTYQREWFGSVREQVSEGQPFAVVNANSPQEMLRALNIPFVVNQWWASIVAAKQQSARYAALLTEKGYPHDVEAYSSQGLAAVFDKEPDLSPWGGLPTPQIVQSVQGTDATSRIFDHWARESQASLYLYERSIESRLDIDPQWWDRLPGDWETEIEPERLDLLTDELYDAIAQLESQTGESFDRAKFSQVMTLVNEQEHYYRLTRDLIAKTYPVPVSVVDTMPATMVPQWHRGTEWARDAAKKFYLEVKARVDAGESACADEKLRLMWIGRGLWSDMAFYQKWEESHGAVFVWSMYLSLAADGYIRECTPEQDPVRALAARFVTMGDELRMPTWAGAWYVKEAQTHGVDGVIALSDADPFVLRALSKAGFKVLSLPLDNFDDRAESRQQSDDLITAFLNDLTINK